MPNIKAPSAGGRLVKQSSRDSNEGSVSSDGSKWVNEEICAYQQELTKALVSENTIHFFKFLPTKSVQSFVIKYTGKEFHFLNN